MQEKVAEFNEATGAERCDNNALGYIGPVKMRAAELRARLILEEAFETAEAMLGCDHAIEVIQELLAKRADLPPDCEWPSLVETIDGLTDLLYVTFGAFDAFGVDADPVFDIVHAANMTKVGAPKDANGKTMKPPGFVPPQERIRELLVKMGAKI